MAAAIASGSSGVITHAGACAPTVACPGMSLTTAAVPLETASSTEKGVPSARLGATNTSAAAYICCTLSVGSSTVSSSPRPRRSPSARASSPPPTVTPARFASETRRRRSASSNTSPPLRSQSQPKCTSSGRSAGSPNSSRAAWRCASVSTGKRSTSTALWRNSTFPRGAPALVVVSTRPGLTHRIWSARRPKTAHLTKLRANAAGPVKWGVWKCQMTLVSSRLEPASAAATSKCREVRVQDHRAVVLCEQCPRPRRSAPGARHPVTRSGRGSRRRRTPQARPARARSA